MNIGRGTFYVAMTVYADGYCAKRSAKKWKHLGPGYKPEIKDHVSPILRRYRKYNEKNRVPLIPRVEFYGPLNLEDFKWLDTMYMDLSKYLVNQKKDPKEQFSSTEELWLLL